MSGRKRDPAWAALPTEELLDLRFSDLGVSWEGTWLEACVEKLYAELESRGLRLRPHFWLSDEWFSPEDVAGVAIPFYLAHPRLTRLERSQMLEVEGGSRDECMKILRHETGHAFQHAYDFQRSRRWQRNFGRSSDPYPEFYQPHPGSREFVQHLDGWYAQSHPDEDFAETFAVWLKPRSDWRVRYRGWPALRKLEYVDALMRELAGEPVRTGPRRRPGSLSTLRQTLRAHYEEKKAKHSVDYSRAYDRDLIRVFQGDGGRSQETAASFLRRHRRELRELVSRESGRNAFTVDQLLKEMIRRSSTLRLRAVGSRESLMLRVSVFLTVMTLQCHSRGPGWHAM